VNVEEYISSGIIEKYVMGLATGPERAEFEQRCVEYPELVAAREAFEREIERFALENAEQPPAGVKGRFLEGIGDLVARPGSSSNQPKIITMENAKSPSRSAGWLRFVAAASVILLIAAAWYAYQSRSENKDLTQSNTVLKTQLDSTHQILQQIIDETRIVKDPNTTVVNMVGTQVAPKSSANVYWDSASTNVFLVVKNMPKLPTDQQYQLWALIDGKPKDLGVFDADSSANDRVILKMNNTQKAQAFAITIEKRGGSPSPTLQKMQSLGKMIQSQ
jgi:anti-sigma-K factor RskA